MNRTVTRREFLKLIGTSGIVALAAGSTRSCVRGYGSLPPRMGQVDTDKYGIMILADGLRADLFFEMLEAGKLPLIKEHIVDRGAMMECVGSLPSTTGPAHLPFLTGTLPGRNHVTGIRWVDRRSRICRDYCTGLEGVLINNDYGLEVPTLFEILHGEKTAAIYGIVNKGATHIKLPALREAWWASGGNWEQFDTKAADLVEDLYKKRPLRFAFVWMPGIDHLAHFEGPTSETVQRALMNVDQQVGRIVDALKRCGIYDRTMISLVADHGLRDNEKHVALVDHLADLGLNVKRELGAEGEWAVIHRYNAVVAVSGNAFAHVYLCDDEGKPGESVSTHGWQWESKKELKSRFQHSWKWEKEAAYESIRSFPVGGDKRVDLVEALLDQEGVGILIVAQKWGKYSIFSSSGSGVIERDSNGYRYSFQGDDPLGYADTTDTAALVADGKFHSGDEWLKASWDSAHPDAVMQICQLFNSHRCGDIVVLAAPGWDLMDEGHIGSHGSIEREEIMVPVVLAGPGIAEKRLKYARTIDIFPTYLKFLGLNPGPLEIDGRALDIFV